MKRERRQIWILIAAVNLALLLILLFITLDVPPLTLVHLLPFLLLNVFMAVFGLHLGGGQVSLIPMATIAAYLVLGAVPAAAVAYLSAMLHGLIGYHTAGLLGEPRLRTHREAFLLALANASIQTLAVLMAGLVYRLGGGRPPLTSLDGRTWLQVIAAGSTFLFINHLLAATYLSAGGGQRWRDYLEQTPRLFLVEGGPLILLAPLMALILTGLGWQPFILFALLLIAVSLITFNLDRTRQRLQRRVGELAGLQAVGRTLSASLDTETVLASVRQEVARLMPADDFYVALYDRDNDLLSFPLAYESGRPVSWSPRRSTNGLTEQVLHSGEPLLIPRDLEGWLLQNDIRLIGKKAGCWLGVPLIAGQTVLGVVTLQSPEDNAYDLSHQQVLQTIAAQAAVALQNAYLYTRTDEALMRSIQELRHILRTIREGILLLNPKGEILAGNRALADFLGITEAEFIGPVSAAGNGDHPSFLGLCGFEPGRLDTICRRLAREGGVHRQQITVPGPPPRPVARTLAPVYDSDETIAGWLLVFRDLTEEQKLSRLREEMTSMLIHDLRSPLSLIRGALQQIAFIHRTGATADQGQLLDIAQVNVERLLDMIDLLLEIGRLENGQGLVERRPVDLPNLLQETAEQLTPLAARARITLEVKTAPALPAVPADPGHLGRVLHNLVDNALKFTPDGGHVRLWARLEPEQDQDSPHHAHLLLGVSDNGPGIPPAERATLFQKFTQVRGRTGRRKGTGLGLAYCRLATEAHGGQIWVESENGSGSTFILRLPLAETPEEEEHALTAVS